MLRPLRRARLLTGERLAGPSTRPRHSIKARASSGRAWVPPALSTGGSLLPSLGLAPALRPLLLPASYHYFQCLENVILSGQGCEPL